MEGGAADRNHSGEGQGGAHTTGNHRGRGEPTATTAGRGRGEPTPQGTTEGRVDTMGSGGRGGLAALHHIWAFPKIGAPDLVPKTVGS